MLDNSIRPWKRATLCWVARRNSLTQRSLSNGLAMSAHCIRLLASPALSREPDLCTVRTQGSKTQHHDPNPNPNLLQIKLWTLTAQPGPGPDHHFIVSENSIQSVFVGNFIRWYPHYHLCQCTIKMTTCNIYISTFSAMKYINYIVYYSVLYISCRLNK